jgi:hypothetical protein
MLSDWPQWEHYCRPKFCLSSAHTSKLDFQLSTMVLQAHFHFLLVPQPTDIVNAIQPNGFNSITFGVEGVRTF